ncbi:uncharacterized protein C3orf14 homolog [Spea bombifrons]|uniref:uncharacterized protein C3orf14 homolog n=1 Tax=Spea bombifrons TaxID=233779 RepID=UPI00234B00E2|nr:uncharacterized protein C3orf14 homolog [Spea bombifrons]
MTATPSHMDREVELAKRREAIQAERARLLEELSIRREERDNYTTERKRDAGAAHARNQAVLQDLQLVEQRLKNIVRSSPPSAIISLEKHYWEFVQAEIPKWEQFLLGKAEGPFDMKHQHRSKQKSKSSQTMQISREKKLPPSGYKTFPR